MCRIVVPPEYWERLREIGKKCREVRVARGYSQREVAEEVKVNPSMVSTFENGGNNSALLLDWYVKSGYRG